MASQAKKKKKKRKVQVPTLPYVRVDEFDNVPHYVRGRLKREAVNECIDAIQKALEKKYTVLSTPRSKMGEHMMKRYKLYKDAECKETDNAFFFLTGDLKELASYTINAQARSCLAVLRNLNYIKELRSAGFVRYILL